MKPLLNDIGLFVEEGNSNNLKEDKNKEKEENNNTSINDFNPKYLDIVELLKYRNKKYNNTGSKEEGYMQCYYDSEKYKNRNYENDFNTNKGFSPIMCSVNRYKYLP